MPHLRRRADRLEGEASSRPAGDETVLLPLLLAPGRLSLLLEDLKILADDGEDRWPMTRW